MSTQNAALVTQLLLQYAIRMQEYSRLLATAQSEGRDVSAAELDALTAKDDEARVRLQALIDARR
jgi:hypothetical protein